MRVHVCMYLPCVRKMVSAGPGIRGSVFTSTSTPCKRQNSIGNSHFYCNDDDSDGDIVISKALLNSISR